MKKTGSTNAGIKAFIQSAWQRGWLPCLLILAATLVAYEPVWHAGFIWDDESYVTENLALRSLEGLRQIWFSLGATVQYYPLTFTSFWLDYHLWGLHPLGYHLINVLLHVLNAVLLAMILRRLNVRGAWLAAAIFALHPACVESVAWVTERKNVLSGFFFLCSLLAGVRFWLPGEASNSSTGTANQSPAAKLGSWKFYWIALVLYCCALLSKTAAVGLPVVVLLLIWWKCGKLRRQHIYSLSLFFVVGVTMGLITLLVERRIGAAGNEWQMSLLDRCLLMGRSFWFYLGKIVWPHPLVFVYPRWTISASRLSAYLPVAATLIAFVILWRNRRTWARPVLFALGYFFVLLFPVLGLLNVYYFRYSFVADHFQYLASIGPLALAGAGITTGMAALEWKPVGRAAAAGVILAMLGLLTRGQIAIYHDVITLYQDTIEKNPGCWMAHYNLAISLRAKGETDEAVRHYRQAIALKPDYGEAHYNLARLLVQKGDLEEAIAHYDKALEINPNDAETHNNLGATLFRAGRIEDAIAHYQQALEIRHDYAEASCNLADAFLRTGRTGEAIIYYEQGLKLRPENADVRTNFASALAQAGRAQEAIVQYRKTLAVAPENVPAQSNLAWLLATSSEPSLRNGSEALRLAETANRLSGEDQPVILHILAASYAETGDFANAMQVARRALDLAKSADNKSLITALEKEIALYQSGSPYHKVRR